MQRKLPSPGFQVEVVLVDYDPAAAMSTRPPSETTATEATENSSSNTASRPSPGPTEEAAAVKKSNKDKDDEFSDSDNEESASSKSRQIPISSQSSGSVAEKEAIPSNQIANLTSKTEQVSLGTSSSTNTELKKETAGADSVGEVSEFKAMAADASIFSFGDDEDDESE